MPDSKRRRETELNRITSKTWRHTAFTRLPTIITVKTWKKRKPPNINITWDDDDDDYTGGPGEGPYWWYTK